LPKLRPSWIQAEVAVQVIRLIFRLTANKFSSHVMTQVDFY
jgi:hypothetical protein